jgi:hypothetical protein
MLGVVPQLLMKKDTPVKEMLHNPGMGFIPAMMEAQHQQPAPQPTPQAQPVPVAPPPILSRDQHNAALRAAVASALQPKVVTTQPVVIDPTGLAGI